MFVTITSIYTNKFLLPLTYTNIPNMNKKSLYFIVIPALFFQTIGAFLYFNTFFEPHINQSIYTAIKLLLLLWPLLYFWKVHARNSNSPNYNQTFAWGLGSGILGIIIFYIAFLFLKEQLITFAPLITQKATELNILNYYILFAIFLSFAHSFLEEYFWRMFVFNGLQKITNLHASYIIHGLAFAAHHFIVIYFISHYWSLALIGSLAITGAGIFWAWLYKKTNTIIGSWVSHICIDLILMYIGYILIFG